MLWEPWEPVGEGPDETSPGRWWGRSSSSDGVPGAPFKGKWPMMDSGEAPAMAEQVEFPCWKKKKETHFKRTQSI